MHGPEGESSNSNGSSRNFSSNGTNGSNASPLHKAALSNSANGTRKTSQPINGSSYSNGSSNHKPSFEHIPKPTYYGHDREEVTRILIQSLTDLGYHTAAGTLSQESGYELESPSVAAFRNAVLEGEWAEAEDLLFGSSRPPEEGGVSLHANGLLLADGADRNVMRFWLRQQKFLEFLEERDTGRALMVLRMELSPLHHDSGRLHFLSSLLMCQSTEDLKEKAEWDGARGDSRHQLLSELSKCISPSIMIPENRLAILLQQVKQSQISNCLYHNTAASPSLYSDHLCDRANFPLRTILQLEHHTGEVWDLKFSHDGAKLATCGGDGYAYVYDVVTWYRLWRLPNSDIEAGGNGICSVSWSPDDSKLVTCSQDKTAKIWKLADGKCLKAITRFQEPVSSCAWAPDGRSFVTGCLALERNLVQWSESGELIYDWGRSHRIQDVAVSPDGNRLVAMDNATNIHVYNFMTREPEYSMDIKVKLTSVEISADSRFLLVGLTTGEAQLWDLEAREVVKTFAGSKGGNYVIRSSFGGANESFVVSGSEDGYVLIWHKENGTLVEKLEGHGKGCCNAISWNPANPGLFASAGDDMKVRVWCNKDTPTPEVSCTNTSYSDRKRDPHQSRSNAPPSSNSSSMGGSGGIAPVNFLPRDLNGARRSGGSEGLDQQQLNRLFMGSRGAGT